MKAQRRGENIKEAVEVIVRVLDLHKIYGYEALGVLEFVKHCLVQYCVNEKKKPQQTPTKKETKDAVDSQGKKGNVGHAKKIWGRRKKSVLRQRKQRSDKGRPRGKYKTKKG